MTRIKSGIEGISLTARNIGYICKRVLNTSPAFFILSAVMSILAGLYPVVQSYIMSIIIDTINRPTTPEGALAGLIDLLPYALVVIVWTLAGLIVYRLQFSMNKVVTEKIAFQMEQEIICAMQGVTSEQMDDPQFHDQLEQAKALVKRKPTDILMNLFSLLLGASTVIGYVTILASLNSWYILVSFAASIVIFIANVRYENLVMGQLFALTPEKRRMDYAVELATKKENFEESKIYKTHWFLNRYYAKSMNRQLESSKRLLKSNSVFYILAALIAYAGTGCVYVHIIYQALLGKITLGSVAMYLTATLGLQSVMIEFISDIAALPASSSLVEKYRSFVGRAKAALAEPKRSEDTGGHSIEFRDVSFRYPNQSENVLNHVSFKLEPHQVAAVVGENGAGKTTMIRLLLRLYDSYEGTILVDGVDIRSLPPEEHLDRFGVMLQNFARYSLNLAESVSLAPEETAENESVLNALCKANLLNECEKLPDGLNTQVSKRFSSTGWEPSGGQWQKLGIARMVYRSAGIYILDEPSASLDAIAEHELYQLIMAMKGQSTVIFISHRFTSIVEADIVLFIDSRGGLWQAPHDQMMREQAEYNRLYSMQAQRFSSKL